MVLLIKVYANKGAIIISEKRKRIHQRKHHQRQNPLRHEHYRQSYTGAQS